MTDDQQAENVRVQLIDMASHYIGLRRDAELAGDTEEAEYCDRQYRQDMQGYWSLRDDEEVLV